MAVIELSFDSDEHILADGEPLCATDAYGEDARVVHHSRDPLADASIHLCPTCARRWVRIRDEVARNETVRCAVDRCDNGTVYTCVEVIPATEARRLDHPDAAETVPVCPDCYEWLLDYPNDISTPYEDAAPWAADAHI